MKGISVKSLKGLFSPFKLKALVVGLVIAVMSVSANAENRFTANAGFLFPATLDATVGYEYGFSYGRDFEVFGELGNHRKLGQGQFWKGYFWNGGLLYKHQLKRFKNGKFSFRAGPVLGAVQKDFFLGCEAGFEYDYVFANGIELALIQKNNVCFLHGDLFRNGLMVGLKIPF